MVDEAIFLSDEEFNQIKKTIAQILYEKGMEQSRISNILQLSQPMVSNYCKSDKTKNKQLLNYAEHIAGLIQNHKPIQFQHCISFSDNSRNGTCYIADKTELIDNENRDIVNTLQEAFLLLKNKNLSGFIPEIKINIVQAKSNASNPDDVAAFVNGLIIVDDIIIGNNGIRFGSSKHLASLLLSIQEKLNINAMMNIAFQQNNEINGFSQIFLGTDFEIDDQTKPVDILHHKGDFGIEPCSYIIGKDAVDVVKKLIKILESDR